jgi:hypothetical protein
VSVHQEDSANSGGPSTHNPVARYLFPEARPGSAIPAVLPPTTASDPIATAVGGIPVYVATNPRPTNTPHATNLPSQILPNPPTGVAAPWPLSTNFIPSQAGQLVPQYAADGYN